MSEDDMSEDEFREMHLARNPSARRELVLPSLWIISNRYGIEVDIVVNQQENTWAVTAEFNSSFYKKEIPPALKIKTDVGPFVLSFLNEIGVRDRGFGYRNSGCIGTCASGNSA